MSKHKRGELLLILYLTAFLNSTGLGTSSFLLPVYAQELGASYVDLGIMGALGSIIYTVGTIFIGYLLDRFERIRFYLISTLVESIVVLSFVATSNVSQVLVFRGLLGAASAAFWVTASTLTADISPVDLLTRSMGRYNMAWIAGFVVGPLIGGYISNQYGFHALFATLASIIGISFVMILFLIQPKIRLQNKSEGKTRPYISALIELRWAYITLIPFTVVLGIYMAIIPGQMRVYGISSLIIGLLITLTNGVRGFAFVNVERFVDWGVRRSLFLASLLLITSMYSMSFASNTLGFGVPLMIYGVAAGIITPVVLDVIAKEASRKILGTAMGLHEGIYGVGMCFGPMVGGWIAEVYNPRTLYLILSFFSVLVIPFAWRLTKRQPKSSLES